MIFYNRSSDQTKKIVGADLEVYGLATPFTEWVLNLSTFVLHLLVLITCAEHACIFLLALKYFILISQI